MQRRQLSGDPHRRTPLPGPAEQPEGGLPVTAGTGEIIVTQTEIPGSQLFHRRRCHPGHAHLQQPNGASRIW
jgi:hypothetical protein